MTMTMMTKTIYCSIVACPLPSLQPIRRWWRDRIRRSALRRWPYVSKPRRGRKRPLPSRRTWRTRSGSRQRPTTTTCGIAGTTGPWAPTTRPRWRWPRLARCCTPGACTAGACSTRKIRRNRTDSVPRRHTIATRWCTRPVPGTGCGSTVRRLGSCFSILETRHRKKVHKTVVTKYDNVN